VEKRAAERAQDAEEEEPQTKQPKPAALQAPVGKVGWKEVDKQRRQRALSSWEALLVQDPGGSTLGRQLANAEDERESSDTLRFAFMDKATATIEKRLGSLLLYGRWARAAGQQAPFPQDEAWTYRYVRTLEAERAPATRAQSFVEAVRFLSFVAETRVGAKALLSSRVLGATMASADRKRELKQSSPIPVRAVAAMEHALLTTGSNAEAVVLGGFLFMIFARARYTDVVRIAVEPTLTSWEGRGSSRRRRGQST